jgi:hypothetical protein
MEAITDTSGRISTSLLVVFILGLELLKIHVTIKSVTVSTMSTKHNFG